MVASKQPLPTVTPHYITTPLTALTHRTCYIKPRTTILHPTLLSHQPGTIKNIDIADFERLLPCARACYALNNNIRIEDIPPTTPTIGTNAYQLPHVAFKQAAQHVGGLTVGTLGEKHTYRLAPLIINPPTFLVCHALVVPPWCVVAWCSVVYKWQYVDWCASYNW